MTQFCEKVKNVQLSKTHSQTHAPAASSLTVAHSTAHRLISPVFYVLCQRPSLRLDTAQRVHVLQVLIPTYIHQSTVTWWHLSSRRNPAWMNWVPFWRHVFLDPSRIELAGDLVCSSSQVSIRVSIRVRSHAVLMCRPYGRHRTEHRLFCSVSG